MVSAHTRTRARTVARRLLDARDPLLPKPQTEQELVSMIESMAAQPRRWGVFLTGADLRHLRLFHAHLRAGWKERSPN